MARKQTSLTFTERAMRVVQSPVMALALIGGAVPLSWSISDDLSPRPSAQAPAANATPQQVETIYQRLATEGTRLHTQGELLRREEAQVSAALDDDQASEQTLVALRLRYDHVHRQSLQKDIDLASYHARLVGSPLVSEQAAQRLYSQSLKGTAFNTFYQQDMAYRDECRLSLRFGNVDISGEGQSNITKRRELKTCMSERVDNAGSQRKVLTFFSVLGGGASYLGLGLMFGAAAGRSRRKADKKVYASYAASLKKLEDLIKPKGQ